MGSSTSFSAAWTTLSATAGMPSFLSFPDPPGFGISRWRTGSGRNVPALSWARRSSRNTRTPVRSSTSRMVMPSTPGVFAPRLPSTRQYATYSVRDRDHLPGRNGAAADAASHRAGPRAVTGAGRWRVLRAVHDRGKIIADLAVAVALGG